MRTRHLDYPHTFWGPKSHGGAVLYPRYRGCQIFISRQEGSRQTAAAVMPVPLNEKLKVTESAYRFWAPVSTKKSIGNAAIILDKGRI